MTKTLAIETIRDISQTFRAILKANESDIESIMDANIIDIQKRHPYACVVNTKLVHGVPHIIDADERIFDIVGYHPEELVGKSVEYIMFKPFEKKVFKNMMDELNKYNTTTKMNTNKHKSGYAVKTLGQVFKLGANSFREIVMPLSRVNGYDGDI